MKARLSANRVKTVSKLWTVSYLVVCKLRMYAV
jgi:hypothetical protein